MRARYHRQLPLVTTNTHGWSAELCVMSEVLDANISVLGRVRADLLGVEKADARRGREGMSAEQVLRAALLKQMWEFSYEDLAFHLEDSSLFRSFCRFAPGQSAPKKSALHLNIAAVSAETWEHVHQALVLDARARKVEGGLWMRTDATVVESHIHHPMDSLLLWDSVRTLARILQKASERHGIVFCNRKRVAKRRSVAILNARGDAQRTALYKDLLTVTHETLGAAERAIPVLQGAAAHTLATKLQHYIPLVKQVISQTERRVLAGESVPAAEKIVSIFEPHTDIIVKDRRTTLYGHKVTLSTGRSGIVTDVVIEDGNPADSTLAVRATERHKALFGTVPERAAFDGAYASKLNLETIQEAGTNEACFSKPAGVPIEKMTSTSRIRRVLKNFRAGIEATISFLKRSFGMSRANTRGLPRFKAYTFRSVVAHNLLVLARRLIERQKPA